MKTEEIKITFNTYTSLDQLQDWQVQLIEAAEKVSYQAYAPYSKFCVGAAILLENGEVITGTNQENAAYPSGLCAERTAIFYAKTQYPEQHVICVAIVARKVESDELLPITPCGACRQALLEYELQQPSPIQILLRGNEGTYCEIKSLQDLLPISFNKKNLGEEAK
ncbi:MAG: cytidine deaminase [Bacteroidota bacterium]